MRRKWIFFVAPPAFVLFVAVGGVVVMLLWNWLLPPLFALPRVGFWQALGLLALARILFGSLGMGGGSRGRSHRRHAERWAELTPEERERLRQSWRSTPIAPPESKPTT